MNQSIIPVILCGGAGSRLWPASRETYPKQLFAFGGQRSLFQETLARVTGPDFQKPIVVTGNDYRFLIAEQLEEMGIQGEIVIEPMRRDSCAAIAAAATIVAADNPDAMLLILAADHAIPDHASFRDHVVRGIDAARAGHIVTFGIQPTHPSTAYGYLQPGETLSGFSRVNAVETFEEKPDAETAVRFVEEGYLWNSGNFLFSAGTFLHVLSQLAPDIHDPVTASVSAAVRDLGFLRLNAEAFARARATSIDYAVMEKTTRVAVVPSDFQWSDVGSWSAVWNLAQKDEEGNAQEGQAMFQAVNNSYVYSPDVLTAVVGLDNVVVVTTRDAVLVAAKDKSEDVKALVSRLAKANRREATEHLRAYRPWGNYEQIDRGSRHQVKRINVKPGGKLSLQSHFHRSEHWVVVSGTARVTVGANERLLGENESIYIPLGATHRLENPGQIPLDLIEVQSGSYLGEDDIVRYEDVYNRA